MTARTVNVAAGGRRADIECAWIEAGPAQPVLVFLHEGLGSLSMWKDFPAELCAALGMRGLVYSRPGYGKSTPRASGERWPVDFMQRQASEVLPALLAALDVPPRSWLFGHSDGASIALLFAAAFPDAPAGVVALAPHLFVEDLSVKSIEATRSAYRSTDLRTRLARYHDDPDSAFFGWNDIWLDPGFRAWNIEREMQRIRCPVLAIQGEDDEYGTMAQVDRLARNVPQARVVKLSQCGHSPHRDRPDRVVDAVAWFVRGL
ncbi:MAG: alpha/beta hydrolase [Casimicrobiaceae bacterium]